MQNPAEYAAPRSDLPPISLLEEFLLLAIDDDAGQFYSLSRSALDCATIGAILMDLSLRCRIDNDLKAMFVTDTMPTGDDILDSVLRTMALAPVLSPLPITHWLRQLVEEGTALRERGLRRLEARGIIRREDKKILWVFGTRRYPLINDREIREVKLRIMGVILKDDIPEAHDMMLTALAQTCGLFSHL